MPETALLLLFLIPSLRNLPRTDAHDLLGGLDTAGKLYPIDAYGKKIRKGESSCPETVSSEVWWDVYTPSDRATWWE
eukprot:11617606-Heterocapsa_arctica.AAC.1